MKTSRFEKTTPVSPSKFELISKYRSVEDQEIYFEKLIEAFRTLSQEAPDVFDNIAPEMLQRGIWSWRGADPLLSKRFNRWISEDYRWTPFLEILPPKDETLRSGDIPKLLPNTLDSKYSDFIDDLSMRFHGDPHRWDASTRDQFIILGLLALAGGSGVRQGKLIHSLGLNYDVDGIRGSNIVRAAKIALSRLANPYDIELFAPATGHGKERYHSFSSPELAEIIKRYVVHHDASILLPIHATLPN